MAHKHEKYVVVEFEDGIQIIPRTWLNNDCTKAKWPDCYVTYTRYDKAVRLMEEPQATWKEHTVVKIFTSCSNYAQAQQKLKLAEDLSDVNTCSEKEEYLKKSRKTRAAKVCSSSDNESELSDEEIDLSLPKPPNKQTDNRKISKKKNLSHIYIRNVFLTHDKVL